MSKKILTVIGARPQFIKAAPVSRALLGAQLNEKIIHTGQHFDPGMSDIFFHELDLPQPAYNLEVHSLGHGAMTGRMLEKIEAIIETERPDIMLVYGDTNSTLAGALAAAKMHVPVAHIEAGLRSFNRRMPEELNRIMADHVSTLLFCPTETAVRNLKAEGICKGVYHVGDVMYDGTLQATARAEQNSKILETLALKPKTYAVATIHRAENTDDGERFSHIVKYLEKEALIQPIVLVAHPRTAKLMQARAITPRGIRIIEPLGYLDMTRLTQNAKIIFTDSGGLQKEAYFYRVPCVTLRDETEWIETIENGWNRLWSQEDYKPQREITDYGSGMAAQIIAARLAEALQKYFTEGT